MTIYILIFLLILLLALCWEVRPFNAKWVVISLGIFLTLFAGLRASDIDKDYSNYEIGVIFIDEISSSVDGASVIPFYEPGFSLLANTANSLSNTYFVAILMLFYAAISMLFKMMGIVRMSSNFLFIILFYFSQYFLLHEMTQIRIGFASALFIFGLSRLCEGKRAHFILIVIIATLFHYSCILYLFILVLDRERLNRKLWLAILFSSLIFGVLNLPVLKILALFEGGLMGKVSYYIDIVEKGVAENINTLNILTLISFFTLTALLFKIPDRFLAENPYAIAHIKLSIISLLVLNLLSSVPSIAFRVSELFAICGIFTTYYIRYIIPNRIIGIAVMLFIAASNFYITLFHLKLLQPYHTIFN